jgi:hypothetical protein
MIFVVKKKNLEEIGIIKSWGQENSKKIKSVPEPKPSAGLR